MNKKHFSILLLIAVVVAAAAFLMPSRTGQQNVTEQGLFLPGLADSANDITMVRIHSQGGDDVVTLERINSEWIVQEYSGYPVEWSVLRPLLAGLSQAKVVELKTSNPEYYARLGVEAIDAESSVSKLVEFPANESVPSVIVGNSPQGREGQYLRLEDEAQSVLVDLGITVPLSGAGWLVQSIVDLDGDDVISLEITHPDGEVVSIERASTEVTDFDLNDIPEGREAASAWSVNQLAGIFSELELEGVAPADEISFEDAVQISVQLADELQIRASILEDEENRWLSLSATGGEDAEAINARVAGWAYAIPLYKFDAMNKRMEDVLAALEESDSE